MSQCKGLTLKGTRCKRICKNGEYCYNHNPPDVQEITECNVECCVCLEKIKTTKLECGHDLCEECAYKWSLSKKFKAECPMCRSPMNNQGYYQHLALERRDAVKCFEYSFNEITQEEFVEIGVVGIPFNQVVSRSTSENVLRMILSLNKDIYSKISKKEVIEVLKDCKCNSCNGYRNGTNDNVYFFKKPSFTEDYHQELFQMIESVMRGINLF